VTGVDLSEKMIALARKAEVEHQLGIEYLVADARQLAVSVEYDFAVAAYLLNYAQNRAELSKMCNSIARCLKPGGRFITVNSNPALDFSSAPSYLKYGFETEAPGQFCEGAPVTWIFHLGDGPLSIENYYLDVDVHEKAFREAGFREIRWHAPQLSTEGISCSDPGYWNDLMQCPPIAFIECFK